MTIDDISKTPKLYKNKVKISEKKYEGIDWNFYYLPSSNSKQTSQEISDIFKHESGYLFYTFKNNQYYSIAVRSDKLKANTNLKSSLFKRYICPMLQNIRIHTKRKNIFDNVEKISKEEIKRLISKNDILIKSIENKNN